MNGKIGLNNKYLLRLLVSVGILLLICGLNSKRVCALDNGEYEYEIINNGKEVEITGYIGTETDVEIPEAIAGLPVTSIGNLAFCDCNNLRSVQMPKVTKLGEGAFDRCINLNSVTMPNVTSIGNNAFEYCDKLSSIDLTNVTTVGNSAFRQCDALQTVIMPNVTTVGHNAFENCNVLKTVEMPKATSIGADAFANCDNLSSVTVSADAEGLDTIPADAKTLWAALTMELEENMSLKKRYPGIGDGITWTSSDSNVVSVDSNGNLEAKSLGTATITAIKNGNDHKAAEFVVTAKAKQPILDNATSAMNRRLLNSLSYAAGLGGNPVVYFEEYNGNDCLTLDVLKFLNDHPNVILVLDYTFYDVETNQEIHVHAVINQAILSKIMRDDIMYYGAAILSGFVQYYNDLPVEIRGL